MTTVNNGSLDIHIGCHFAFDLAVATHAVVIVEPHPDHAERTRAARFTSEPARPSSVYVDSFGNACRRLDLGPGTVELGFDAVVTTSDAADPVVEGASLLDPSRFPSDVLMFLLPSRYCESDVLADVATSEFGSLPPGWAQVQAVSDWVHRRIGFDYESSSPTHTAASVYRQGRGVCRDFAHLSIALCRALHVPTRYVFGYLPEIDVPPSTSPPDFCAWTEVFLGGEWHTFDPRNNERRIGRVVIGRGRDAADVAMVTTFGSATLLSMAVWAEQASA